MAYLQLMGRNLFLRKKNGKVSMMESFKTSMKDVEFVQDVQINSGASHDQTFNELHTKSFNKKKCRNILDFITLIKMDFPQEAYIKRRLFGRRFENMACPSLTKCYIRCITIGQTFSDTFSFIELEKCYIRCTSFKDDHVKRLINKCVKPCTLTMMRHVMMAFIQSEILTKCDIGNYDFHDFVANNVFFHDRLIERWMCEIDADVVFHEFSTKTSPGNSLESKKFKKKCIHLIRPREPIRHKKCEDDVCMYGHHLRNNCCTRREATILHHLAYGAMTLFRATKLRFLHHAVGSMWWVACTTSKN